MNPIHETPRRLAVLLVVAAAALMAPASESRAQPQLVTIIATDFAFQAPPSIRAGLTAFRLVNRSKSNHHIVILRLPEGVSEDDYARSVGDGKNARRLALASLGGPETPVDSADIAALILEIRPGRYMLTCEYRDADGRTHAAKGMHRMLNVFRSSRVALYTPPPTDAVVSMKDFSFTLSKPVYNGPRVFRLENRGTQEHQMMLGRLLPGRSMRDALTWLRTRKGAPPFAYAGGTTRQSPGRTTYLRRTFQKGEYLIYCSLPEVEDRRPHFEHGMVSTFTVK